MSLRVAPILVLVALAAPARAERLVPVFDPARHVNPPTMRDLDGNVGPLTEDADFKERAARWRREHPSPVAAAGGVTVVDEVVVVQGDDQLTQFDGVGYGVSEQSLSLLSQRVIQTIGDKFHAITLWTTFDDRANAKAEAYELNVRNDIQGLGPMLRVVDNSRAFGSSGVLRSILNMKAVGVRAGDTQEQWLRGALPTWGQEGAHRWLMFMYFRDPRTGRPSDAMLGRDCAHYSKFVDTQGSVHDGYAWHDNGDGTFSWTDFDKRYGFLDLYGMGLMAADEVPPFFLIDDIPGYQYPTSCTQYGQNLRPPAQRVQGHRVDITIDDVIAANGERVPNTDDVRQDYWREAQVVLISPRETIDSPNPRALVSRIKQARLWWEAWNAEATQHRLVVCTQVSADCGDPRSDVGMVTPPTKAPGSGPLPFVVEVRNDGGRPATNVKANLELTVGDEVRPVLSRMVGTVAPGASLSQTFTADLRAVACGTEVKLKATTQSDQHYSRKRAAFLIGTEDRVTDGFEDDTGWTTNPDGTDSATGAAWERGTPESTEVLRKVLQAGGAHGGEAAWATGIAASGRGNRANLVTGGRATLQSSLYDTAGLRDPKLRYWISFAGVRADVTGTGLEASPDSKLLVLARAVDATAQGATPAGDWQQIDELDNRITHGWEQRTVDLPMELLTKNKLQLRFVAVDGNPEQGGVKAAIDDLEITSNLPACYGGAGGTAGSGGCACDIGSRDGGRGVLTLAVAVLIAVTRRRRARLVHPARRSQ